VRTTKARPVVISLDVPELDSRAVPRPGQTAPLSSSGTSEHPRAGGGAGRGFRCGAGNAGKGSSDPPSGTVLAPQGRPAIKGRRRARLPTFSEIGYVPPGTEPAVEAVSELKWRRSRWVLTLS
jgi:hypothetical protein